MSKPTTPSVEGFADDSDVMTKWEERFWLMWGLAPEGSLKYKKGLEVKSFLAKELAEARESLIEEIREGVTIGAIPQTDPYALGWNDARKTYHEVLNVFLDSLVQKGIDK